MTELHLDDVILSPHCDDESLFCSFLIQRIKPLVIIITDSFKHEQKYGKSMGIAVRQTESEKAVKILGGGIDFLGIPDNSLYLDNLIVNLEDLKINGKIFAPALQGGHKDHDIVSLAATKVFGSRVIYYSTYEKNNLQPYGELAIVPTEAEKQKKEQALSCYVSQLGINRHHFEAVKGFSEYINLKPC